MKSHHMRQSTLLSAGITLALIGFAGLARADASCDAVYDAGIKQMQTPHHVFSSRSGHGDKGATTNETIFVGGVVYTQLQGKWQRSRMTAADMLAHAQEKKTDESSDETCRAVGDDAVDGEAAAVYALHNDAGADSKLWISKASGSLLRQTIKLPDGSMIDSRYDYKNVQAPPDAR
jgi:hypothetical protein